MFSHETGETQKRNATIYRPHFLFVSTTCLCKASVFL